MAKNIVYGQKQRSAVFARGESVSLKEVFMLQYVYIKMIKNLLHFKKYGCIILKLKNVKSDGSDINEDNS